MEEVIKFSKDGIEALVAPCSELEKELTSNDFVILIGKKGKLEAEAETASVEVTKDSIKSMDQFVDVLKKAIEALENGRRIAACCPKGCTRSTMAVSAALIAYGVPYKELEEFFTEKGCWPKSCTHRALLMILEYLRRKGITGTEAVEELKNVADLFSK
ncbi:hypothetical protein EYM_01915 [Ignicoccus islandicus DSM 13165]|uniref:Tyrosine specific protein phosphatases domain-containing protein n=1 Tax=Ignicoccus islandicus DSM 13165 TaxID=940295 RepID=A0A0U3F8B4_9CREN|nr:hypothetical protein [Ignicoccus islandicus]ALU12264.1 hypothetical protein EYM_01915 [Ignicoccus islandicus DSM 13165]